MAPLEPGSLGDPRALPALWVHDTSSLGTFVDGEKAAPPGDDGWAPVALGARLRFGTGDTGGVVSYSPLVGVVVRTPSDTLPLPPDLGADAAALGCHLLPAPHWDDDATVLLTLLPPSGAARCPPAGAAALLAAAPVLSVGWIHAALAAPDPEAAQAAWAVSLTDPGFHPPPSAAAAAAAGAAQPAPSSLLLPAAFPPRRGQLLRGVLALFGPESCGGVATQTTRAKLNHPTDDVTALSASLAPWDQSLGWAVRAAGGEAVSIAASGATGAASSRAASDAVAALKAGGARVAGIVLVRPPPAAAAAAAASGVPPVPAFAASAQRTDPHRLLGVLCTASLGSLAAPAGEDEAGGRRGGGAAKDAAAAAAADAADGSATDEDAPAPTAAGGRGGGGGGGTQASRPTQPGFVGAAGKRARPAASTALRPPPPPPPPPAPKGKGKRSAKHAALAIAIAGSNVPLEDPEPDVPVEPGFYGDVEEVPLIVAPAVAQRNDAARGGGFKRFRKVGVLPSSATLFTLLLSTEPAQHAAADGFEGERRDAKKKDKAAASLFGAAQPAMKKTRAPAKKKA